MLNHFFKILLFILIISNTANSNELFETNEFIIEFQSNDINLTKKNKIEDIKLLSLKNILFKILLKKDYEKILKNIDLIFVDKFIMNILIKEEKIIKNNYYSKIKINFNKNYIIDYLVNNKINYVNYLPENFLIIIYDQDLYKSISLSKNNKFYKYLLNSKNYNSFFQIPNLDINDRFLITEKDIINRKLTNRSNIIKKYNNENIIILHSAKSNSINIVKSFLLLKNKYEYINEISINDDEMNHYFKQIQNHIIDKWKSKNLIITTQVNNFECKIKSLNLLELKKIKSLISANHIIKNFTLKKISVNENIYLFHYFGNINILINSLKRQQLDLIFNEGNCNIKLI